MTPERFWELVGTLDGVADEETCARLDALLRETGEGPAFTDLIDDHVEPLVETCHWLGDIAGSSTMDWVAAAVIASGKARYDAVLARGEVDPDEWEWSEAEALLVAGFEETEEERANREPDDHGEAAPPVAVTLQWLSVPSPEGVHTPHDHDPEGIMIDLGDHPDLGRTPVHDPDWLRAQEVLAADESFLARRSAVGAIGLWLTVRPVPPDDEPAPDPRDHSPFDGFRPVREAIAYGVTAHEGPGVVLVVPATDFPLTGSRVDGYVHAVHQLLQAAETLVADDRES